MVIVGNPDTCSADIAKAMGSFTFKTKLKGRFIPSLVCSYMVDRTSDIVDSPLRPLKPFEGVGRHILALTGWQDLMQGEHTHPRPDLRADAGWAITLKRIKDGPLPKIVDAYIIMHGHPVYDSLLEAQRANIHGAYNSFVAQLVRDGVIILATVVGSMTKAHRDSPFYTLPPSHFDPSLVGKIVYMPDVTVPKEAIPSLLPTVYALDGIIGGGKTTLLVEMMKKKKDGETVYIPEPVELIYSTIAKCKEKGLSDMDRQEYVEAEVYKYEMEKLATIPPGVKEVLIERNWAYSEWVFGTLASPYPMVTAAIANRLHDLNFGGNYFHKVDPKVAYARMLARGHGDHVSLTKEEILHMRLILLFSGPYAWELGRISPTFEKDVRATLVDVEKSPPFSSTGTTDEW